MGKPSIKVSITDKGLKRSVEAFFGKNYSTVKVGVFGDKGDAEVSDKDGAPTNLTVSALAAIHEFGGGNVPERSFIRSYFDGRGEQLRGMLGKLMETAMRAAIAAGRPITDADRMRVLNRLGLKMQTDIQMRISAGDITPPLDPKTIARKGSSTPLIDTGQLRSSITYEVKLNDTEGSDQ